MLFKDGEYRWNKWISIKDKRRIRKSFDQEVIDLANKIQDIKIYDDPKIDELFKTIFGNPRNKDITIRF